MEIDKPILHPGILKHDLGNINYTESFLKRLAESQNVDIELNDHLGEKLGKVSKLEYKDNALYATMDIPDEHYAEKVAFSVDIMPSDYDKIDSMTFEPTDGVLKSVVYVNNGNKVRDTKTITFLHNLDEEGEIDMADIDLAQELGAMKTRNAELEAEIAKMKQKNEKLESDKTTLEQTLQEKESELTNKTESLTRYKQAEEERKAELIKSLVKDEDDPLVEVYSKMEISDIQILANSKPPSTPPKGVGTQVTEQDDGSDEGEPEPDYDYKKVKAGLGLR